MFNTLDYEGDDDIVAHYENEKSDDEHGNLGEADEATSDNDKDNGTARRIDPSKSKTHIIRNPVPKLNTERLKGRNGIQIIEKYFEGFKFYGKGHEKEDLDRIMKRLEHWSYRLFPKYHFDDFLTRAEQLGTKKDLQVFMKRYRLDMINPDNDIIIDDDTDNEDQQETAPIDDFDLLITEQIQKQKLAEASIPPASASNEDAFDELLAQSNNISHSQVEYSSTSKTQLSDEIKEKIERNKQLAIQRRREKQKEHEEEIKRTKLIENTNVDSISENNNLMVYDETNTFQVDTQSQANMQSQIDESTKKIISNKSDEVL